MYKIVLSHEVLPGKLPEVVKWMQKGDDEARKKNPDFKPPSRFIGVFGSVNELVVELEADKIPEVVYAEATHNRDLIPLIVPGRTVMQVFKRLEFR